MKLIYLEWKWVKAFLASMDEPVSSEFQIIIRTKWQGKTPLGRGRPPGLVTKSKEFGGRWVYEIEIPVDMVVISR